MVGREYLGVLHGYIYRLLIENYVVCLLHQQSMKAQVFQKSLFISAGSVDCLLLRGLASEPIKQDQPDHLRPAGSNCLLENITRQGRNGLLDFPTLCRTQRDQQCQSHKMRERAAGCRATHQPDATP
eukprot:COSAG02_NODE_28_length_51367_cov_70.053932_45_plen_127_part_00